MFDEGSIVPETFIRTNEDSDFPLRLDFNIDQNSVEYNKRDEPIYGNEYALNPDKLGFELLVSLKEEYNDFDSFELTIAREDNNEIVSETVTDSGNTAIISNLAVDNCYSFDLKLTAYETVCGFVGSLTIGIEIDNCIVTDIFYQNSFNEGAATTYIAPLGEGETNDTQATATPICYGVSILGSFSSASDIDKFYVSTIPPSNKNISFELSLSAPATTKVKLSVQASNGFYATKTSSAPGKGVYIRIPSAQQNLKYYITVECISSTWSSGKYYLNVNKREGLTWFSQYKSTIGSFDIWNPNMLDEVKLSYGGTRMPVYVYNGSCWMNTSCGIVAAAMVLNSMGKTYYGYDLRTNYSGQMPADPYTVMLANCELDGTTVNTATNVAVKRSPDDFWRYVVGSKFNMSCDDASASTINITEKMIQDHIDKYGHCLVYFSRGVDTPHWMVFTDYDKSASTFADRYTVYDPAAIKFSQGAGVKLSQTLGPYTKMQISNISTIVSYY